MHNIGNEADAKFILEWVSKGRKSCDVPSAKAPEGWEFLGRGSFRSVWRSPEGVAYKVNHSAYDSQSRSEVRNLRRAWLKKTPKGCRLPRFAEYRPAGEVVVAMEVIKGKTLHAKYGYPDCLNYHREEYRSIERTYRLDDMHEQNVMIDEDGLLVPVDLGC
jgi:RIO-like serine/threonine protein kinase